MDGSPHRDCLMAGFDSTLGGSTATSYISIDEADSLLTNTRYITTWQGNTEAQKSEYLVSATFWLDQLKYVGTRCSPSTDNSALPQALSWPRSGASCDGVEATCASIPNQIKSATAILAAELTANPGAINGPIGGGGNAPTGTYVKRQKLDVLEIEYDEFSNPESSSCDTCGDPAIIQAFPWLVDLLGCWAAGISTGSNQMIRLYRN